MRSFDFNFIHNKCFVLQLLIWGCYTHSFTQTTPMVLLLISLMGFHFSEPTVTFKPLICSQSSNCAVQHQNLWFISVFTVYTDVIYNATTPELTASIRRETAVSHLFLFWACRFSLGSIGLIHIKMFLYPIGERYHWRSELHNSTWRVNQMRRFISPRWFNVYSHECHRSHQWTCKLLSELQLDNTNIWQRG